MNWHPTEDELILHYYGEAPAEIRSATEDHLAACSSCQDAWRELNMLLGAVTAVPVPEPPEGFERVMWARISRELPHGQPAGSTLGWLWSAPWRRRSSRSSPER